MASVTIACEQAIFTSARGPTGEGYRIVGASKGVRAEEKQKITRCSPSHESLCAAGQPDSAPPMGAAFYALPGGRYCIALSRHAGAEHTGRGGQRVYTHNLILGDDELAKCGFNPFTVIRGMINTPMDVQKLSTGGAIPAFDLVVDDVPAARLGADFAGGLTPGARAAALQSFLDAKPVVVDVSGDWIAWAEAMILAVPVPLRLKLSFAAGIKYSIGRGHTLHLIRDEKNAAQTRATAQGIAFVGSKTTHSSSVSQWGALVERYWSAGDLRGLARRTSRVYEDCTRPARERVAELFNQIDNLAQTETVAILDMVFQSFNAPESGMEGEVRRELREAAQHQLKARFTSTAWSQIKPVWGRLVELWRNGGQPASFVQPLLAAALMAALHSDPASAAELALTVAQVPGGADRGAHESLLQQLFSRLATGQASAASSGMERLAGIMQRWRSIRPACPLVAHLCNRMAHTQA